jgi:hypothetical protein
MKRHIKASLITAAILAAFVELGYLIILYPKLLGSIFMYSALAVVVVAIYNLVLLNINKDDNEKI